MILDHIDKLELPDNELEDHYDARMALARLGEGLFWIHREVGKLEVKARREAAKDDTRIAISGGILDNMPLGLLSCCFQWYAVSVCNYAQLVGWLVKRNTEEAKAYVEKAIPRILKYRNKVAAHFAITNPRRDNEADLSASIMTHIIYVHGRLCAAALTPTVTRGGTEIKVSKDISWSLTLAHERLVNRYWPQGEPKSYQSLKVGAGETVTLNISWSDLLSDGS